MWSGKGSVLKYRDRGSGAGAVRALWRPSFAMALFIFLVVSGCATQKGGVKGYRNAGERYNEGGKQDHSGH